MRSLIRSLALLSLSAAPLAIAATPEKAVTPSAEAVSTAAPDTTPVPASGDVALARARVLDLEATLNDMRRELTQLQEQENARIRAISEPSDQFNWGQSP